MTASEMFGVPVKDMPSEVRRRAKAINFGIIYGISAFGLANQLGIPREEAGAYIRKYFERFPGIRDYMDATKKQARADGYVAHHLRPQMPFPAHQRRRTRPSARSTSAPRSTRRSRARPPTSSAARWSRMDDALGAAQARARRCCCRCMTNWCSRRRDDRGRGDDQAGRQGDGRGAAAGGAARRAAARSTRARRTTGTRRIDEASIFDPGGATRVRNGPRRIAMISANSRRIKALRGG